MEFEVSEFEFAVFLAWFVSCAVTFLIMVAFFQLRHRRTPLGRIAPHRWSEV